ncbi:MAG: phage terminase large subunit family protein, partial [Planctomycetota bacterium]
MTNSNNSSEMLQRLAREKARRGQVDPWTWFMAYRKIRGVPPEVIHALVDIINDPSPVIVIQKAAQVGVTELLVSLALWAADTGYAGRGNVLYLMPTKAQMDDFVQSRFDQAIRESEYLTDRLRPEPPGRRGADNRQIKRFGNSFIYFRGTESTRAISSVDADLVILDEFDQMAAGTQERVLSRIASSSNGKIIIASTPRIPGAGISALYLKSDRNIYQIPCPSCGLEQPLEWDRNVDQDAAEIVCNRCRSVMDGTAAGRWVPASGRDYPLRGYHLSQLYTSKLDLGRLIDLSKRPGVRAREEFHNSYLGEPFTAEGGGIQLADLDHNTDDYSFDDYDAQPCVMGVDIGIR